MGMASTLEDVVGDVRGFLSAVFAVLNAAALQPSADDLFCDHLCYRVETEEAYQQKKNQLAELATLLHEAVIGGRLVATYKLKEPVAFGDRRSMPPPRPSPSPSRHEP